MSEIRQGRPPYEGEEVKRRLEVLIEPGYIRQIAELARQAGMTKSALARQLLIQGLTVKP